MQSLVNVPAPVVSKFKMKSYEGDYMKIAQKAEVIVKAWLIDHPDVLEVDDLTHIRQLQRVDTDLVVVMADGTTPLAEVKWDRWLGRTQYVLVEVLRLNHKAPAEVAGVLGWTLRTVARWILYYAPSLAMVYQFKTEHLRQSLQKYTDENRENTQWCWVNTDQIKSTVNILMPLRYCDGAYRRHDVFAYTEQYAPELVEHVLQYRLRAPKEPLQW